MELANDIPTACFAALRIIIIRVCVNSIVMARFILRKSLVFKVDQDRISCQNRLLETGQKILLKIPVRMETD